MMLCREYLDFSKIAKIVSQLESSSLRLSASNGGASGSRSGYGYGGDRIGSDEVNNTLSKAREKHDTQPLAKNRQTSRKPTDMYRVRKSFKTQRRLAHIEDKRLTDEHLRHNRSPLRLGGLSRALSS